MAEQRRCRARRAASLVLPALGMLAGQASALPLETLDPIAKARFEQGTRLEE